MKIKSLLLLSLITATAIALTACSSDSVKSTLNTLTALESAETSWQAMSDDFDKGKESYAKNRTFFTAKEQTIIDSGLNAMDQSRAKLKQIKQQQDAKKLVAISQFITAYSDAKKGYLLIRSVLQGRYKSLSKDNQATFERFDSEAKKLDAAVNKLRPKGETAEQLKQLNSLISLGVRLLDII